jgi:hypothetical protein
VDVSTRFLQGVHKDGRRTQLYDSDSPLDLVMQLVEDPAGWTVTLFDYRGEPLVAEYEWRNISVTITMGGMLDLLLMRAVKGVSDG